MGFDFRHFKETFSSHFKLHKVSTSPFAILGSWLMPEVYFVTGKANCDFRQNGILPASDNAQQ